jgi:hypothetical protein
MIRQAWHLLLVFGCLLTAQSWAATVSDSCSARGTPQPGACAETQQSGHESGQHASPLAVRLTLTAEIVPPMSDTLAAGPQAVPLASDPQGWGVQAVASEPADIAVSFTGEDALELGLILLFLAGLHRLRT